MGLFIQHALRCVNTPRQSFGKLINCKAVFFPNCEQVRAELLKFECVTRISGRGHLCPLTCKRRHDRRGPRFPVRGRATEIRNGPLYGFILLFPPCCHLFSFSPVCGTKLVYFVTEGTAM